MSRPSSESAGTIRRKGAKISLAAAVAAVLTSQSASAGILTWKDADPNNIWDLTTTTNWVEGAAWNNTTPDEATFAGPGEAISLGANITAAGLTFNASGYTIGGTSTLTLGGAAPTITVTNAGHSATISSVIAGTAGLTKTGAGTLTLSGANTYTGNTTINAGSLQLGDGTINGTLTSSGLYQIDSGATLYLNNATVNALANNGWGTRLRGSGTLRLNIAATGFQNWGPNSATATVFDPGFTGALQLDKGRIDSSPAGLGGVSSITINSGAQFLAWTGTYNQSFTLSGAVTDGAGESGQPGALRVASGNRATFSGNITLTGNSGFNTQDAAAVMTINGGISGDFAITKHNAGQLVLTGNNTYTGATTINAGTLEIAGSGTLGSGTYSAGITNNGAFKYSSSASQTLSGAITGTGALTKTGVSTLTISGANTYTGSTTVNGGTLKLNFADATTGITSNIISGSSALVMGGGILEIQGGSGEANTQAFNGVSGGGVIRLTQNGATSINVDLGAVTGMGSIDFGGNTTVAGGLAVTTGGLNFKTSTSTAPNDGTIRLGAHLWNGTGWASTASDGTNTYVVPWQGTYTELTSNGGLSDSAGNLRIKNGGAAGVATTYNNDTTADSLLMAASAYDSAVEIAAGKTLTLGNGAGATGVVAIGTSAKSLTIGSAANQGTLTAGASGASTLTLNSTNAASTLTVNSVIANNAGAGAVSLATLGKVVLKANNTYTGTTTINGGVLEIGGNGTLGNGNYGAGITNNGALLYSSSAGQTLSGVISGTGNLTMSGSSTLILTGANTYSGSTTVSSGTLQIGPATGSTTATAGAGLITIAGGASFIYNRTDNYTVASAFSGSGALQFNGSNNGSGLNGQSAYSITGNNAGFSGTLSATNMRVSLDNANDVGTAALSTGTNGQFYITAGTYTNNFTIAGDGWGETAGQLGAIRLQGGTIAGTITLAGDARISSYGGSGTILGSIVGDYGVAFGSTGGNGTSATTLTLAGANTYTGATTIGSAGKTASVTLTGSLGSTVVTVNTGSTFQVGNGGTTGTLGSGSITDNGTLTFNRSDDNTVSNTISGTGALTKAGAGTLTLSGTNSYTGATTISAGVLSVGVLANGGANSAIGASTNAVGNLSFGGGTLRYIGDTATTDRAFTLTANSGIEVANAATTLTFANDIAAAGGSKILTKTGNGTLVLGGSADNSSLFLSVASGEVDLAKSANTVRAAAGIASVSQGAIVKLTGTGTDQIYDLSASANMGVNGLAGTLDLNGHTETTSIFAGISTGLVTNSATGTNAIWTVGNTNATSAFAGTIQDGNGTIAVVKTGTGTQTLSGTNTYTGGTTITGGTLQVTKAAALAAYDTAGKVTVNSGTVLAINAGGTGQWTSGEIDTLLAKTTFQSNTSVLGIDTTGGDFSYGSDISAAVALRKLGSNTLMLSGNSSYTGVTSINGGVLSVSTLANGGVNSSIGASTNAAGNLSLAGGTLRYTGNTVTTDRAFSLAANSSIEVTNPATTLTFANDVAANGGSSILTKIGSGTLVLAGTADNSSVVLSVTEGEVDLAKSGASTARAVAGIASVAPGATVKLTGPGTDQIYDGSNAANRGVFGLAGTLDLNGHTEATSNFAGTSTGLVTNSATGTNVIWTVGNTNATSAFSGTIQNGNGTIALVKAGTGTQTLSGTNTYTGGTTVSAGTLQVTKTAALPGYDTTGKVTVNSGATLAVNAGGAGQWTSGEIDTVLAKTTFQSNTAALGIDTTGGDFSYGSDISAAVALRKLGSNTLTLSGNNSYTGGMTLAGGVLALASDTALGTGTLNLNAVGATIRSADATTRTIANAITLSTDTVFGSASTGNLKFTGAVNAGTAAKAFTVNNSTTEFSGAISGAGGTANALTKNGPGTLILSGTNTFTHSTTINGGTLLLDYTANNNDKVASGSALNFGGGSLSITPNASANTTQTVLSTALNAGAATITVNKGAAGTTTTLNLNGITRTAGATMNVVYGGAGTGTAVATTDATNTNSILGGWATFNGTDWAVNSGTTDGAIAALGTYATDTWATGNNTTVTNAGANPVSGSTTNSLRFSGSGAKTLTLAGTNTITSGGILMSSATGGGATTITGGTVSSGAADLIVSQFNTSNTLTINSVIGTNLTKTGGGTLALNNAAAGSLPTNIIVNQGTLQIGGGAFGVDKMNGNGVLTINPGATAVITAAHALGGSNGGMTESVVVNGGTLTMNLEQYFNNLTLTGGTVNGSNELRTSNASNIVVNGTSASRISSVVSLVNAGNFNVADATSDANPDLTISGVVSNTGAFNKSGAGTLTLTAANTYSGATTISAGTLQLGASNVIPDGAGKGNVTVTGTLDLNAFNETINGLSGAGTVDNVAGGGSPTLTVGGNDATASFGGVIKNTSGTLAFAKVGAGIQTLTAANTYVGPTIVGDGTLAISGSIAASTEVEVKNNAKLLLGGTLLDRIGDLASLTLGGGTGSNPAMLLLDNSGGQISESVGALELASTAVLDLGTGSAGSVFHFADSSAQTWTGTLNIYNWSSDSDHLFFGNSFAGLTSAQLSSITFYSDAGTTSLGAATFVGGGEIAPVPEPSALAMGVGMLGYLFSRRRRRNNS